MQIQLTPSDDFDLGLRILQSVGGGTLVLMPGRYTTKGCWAHSPSWGLGMNNIRIVGLTTDDDIRPEVVLVEPVMTPGGVFRPQKDVNIIQLGANVSLDSLTFDCSLPAYPTYCIGGVRFAGKFSVKNCSFIGLRGNKSTQTEVFVVSAQGNTGGSVVDRVDARDVTPNSYVSGIYLGGTVYTTEISTVSNCHMALGGGNMFCFAANFSTKFSNCTGNGAEAFFHNDFGPTVNCSMVNCSGTASEAAFRLIGTDLTTRELVARNCVIDAPRALVLWQVGNVAMTGSFVALDCQFPSSTWAACAISPNATASFVDCTFPGTPECQYKSGTLKPSFLTGPSVAPAKIKYVAT